MIKGQAQTPQGKAQTPVQGKAQTPPQGKAQTLQGKAHSPPRPRGAPQGNRQGNITAL